MKNIPYGKQDINQADIDEVLEVLKSDFLTQGHQVPRFESILADYCSAKYAVATNSATSALHIACLALDVGPGDVVWTTPTTFVATANVALYCGARVDFVDIDSRTCNMSVERLEEKLAKAKCQGALPKVVIPVHLCGQSCDMKAIKKLADEYGFYIIEDASHAIGARYLGGVVGNCHYSDITVFSFHPVKIITTGEGGVALTNEQKIHDRMRLYRSHGVTSDPFSMDRRPIDEIWNYQQIRLGFNYRMTDIQAALGASQMNRLDYFVERRREIAANYDSAFEKLPVVVPLVHKDTLSSFHLYPIRIRKSLCGKTQRQVYDALWDAGIGVNLHYIPVYRHPYYASLGFQLGYCPEAELYHREAISLPIFPKLSNKEQEHVIATLVASLSR